jgi:hypothetical protein
MARFVIGDTSRAFGADIYPPEITGITKNALTSIRIGFDEKVEKLTSENPANYAISPPVAVISVVRQSSEREVVLTTAEHAYETEYTVTVSNVMDQSDSQNVISAPGNTAVYTFYPSYWVQVSDIAAKSGHAYEVDTLREYKTLYIDRSYAFTRFPQDLTGASYIRTRKDDQNNTSAGS